MQTKKLKVKGEATQTIANLNEIVKKCPGCGKKQAVAKFVALDCGRDHEWEMDCCGYRLPNLLNAGVV